MKKDLLVQLDEWANNNYPDMEILIPSGLEEAFLGVAFQVNTHIPIFSKKKCLEILMDQGLSSSDALEFFELNVQGAWVGENTPAFLDHFNPDNES
jgi:hypothetical protein